MAKADGDTRHRHGLHQLGDRVDKLEWQGNALRDFIQAVSARLGKLEDQVAALTPVTIQKEP